MNWYFIHVPKTGGASLCQAMNIPLGQHYKSSELPGVFKFAFVRNPYTRFASVFHYLRDTQKIEFRNASLRDCVLSREWANSMFMPMNQQLDAAVGFIGRYEYLVEDHLRLCQLLDIPHKPLPRLHQTDHEQFDEEMRAVIYEYYREDFDRFGYDV